MNLPTKKDWKDFFKFRSKMIITREVLKEDDYDKMTNKIAKKVEKTRQYIKDCESLLEKYKEINKQIKSKI